MKIAYLSNSRFPSERAHVVQTVHVCNAFSTCGNEVTLITTDRFTNITENIEDFYGDKIQFNIERVKVPDLSGNILKYPKFLWSFFYTVQRLIFAYRSNKILDEGGYDIAYGRDHWILAVISFISNISVVWESHEAKFNFPAKHLVKRCKKIIVISEGIRDFYLSKGVGANKLLVAHDGIDESFFDPTISKAEARARLGIDSNLPVVMYIGGLDKWKGVETLFEAGINSQDNFSVFVVGGNEDEIQFYQDKYPKVNFLGYRPYKELRFNQQAADILVVPNTAKNKLSAEYTSPLKVFAHMTSGIPMVVSDISSLRNILGEEQAYFFTADSSDALNKAILEVLANPEMAKNKANSAMIQSKHYTWNLRAKKITDFIV